MYCIGGIKIEIFKDETREMFISTSANKPNKSIDELTV
jgi:hypothetical protein